MIHVNRARYHKSGQLIEPDEKWFKLTAAEQLLANAAEGGTAYVFKQNIYGADVVKAALDELFYGKCGYCEFKLIRTDQNVDHYRPKGRVAEATKHRGYYWLAYEWTNLIPSCTHCNPKRGELAEFPVARRAPAAGKHDSFPLVDESKRAQSPLDDLSLEEPLLLNPTTDHPQVHLTFHPDGMVDGKTDKGKESIRILNLNAHKLYQDRRCTILKVVEWLTMKDSLKLWASDPNARTASKKVDASINRLTSDSAQYAAAARAVVGDPTAFGL